MLGVLTYIAIAVGSWVIVGFVLVPIYEPLRVLIPIFIIPVPLFLSGLVTGRKTLSNYRGRRILFGVVASLIGLALISFPLNLMNWIGGGWFVLVMYMTAALVSALGAFIGTREVHAL